MRGLALIALILAACLSPSPAQAGERLASDAFVIADGAAAAAWVPLDRSGSVVAAPERTPDGEPAAAFRVDMSGLDERAYWDRTVSLDLSRFGRISFWAKAGGDLSAIGHCSLYLHSGAGWYATSFSLPDDGWQRVVIDRGSFTTEGSPQGWDAIDTIRVSFWKGQSRQAVVYLGGLEATASDVVVVRNTRAGREAQHYTGEMVDALARAGVEAGTVDDLDVEAGVLTGKRIAIYPLNPSPSDAEIAALEAFIRAGGRVVVCYSMSPRLATLVGVESLGHQSSEYTGEFARMRFLPGGPPGLPEEVKQDSWNIESVRPAGLGTRVIAEWLDSAGKDTGFPAVILSDTGAYISHVLLGDDPANKDRLVRALLGHLYPELWEQMAQNATTHVGPVARWAAFTDAEAGVRESAKAAGRLSLVEGDLVRARQSQAEAQACLQEKRYPEALELASQVRQLLLGAYVRCQPAREGEFRAGWCHSGYGVVGLTWDESIRRLKESGFNAIVVNSMRAGIADYNSELLPVRDRVAKEGDQIALAVAAGKKYGVQVHVWKVNWNLGGAPDEFVDRMRAEGRLQRTRDGKETQWLCPSDPRNLELERDSMLEVVRKYDVDGIHFDYIRYGSQDNCYCDGCRQRFVESAGVKVADWPKDVIAGGQYFAAYQEFRRGNITHLVKAVSEEAHRLKPWIRVSAAVFSNWPQCREDVGQDWGFWVKQGYLDFVCPMDYTASDAEFRTLVQVQRDAVGGRIPLYPGIGASAPGLPLGQVIDQIGIARAEGADGFILFEYQGGVAADYVPALGKGITEGTTCRPHDAPLVTWQLRQNGKALEGPATADAPVEVEAVLALDGRFAQRPLAAHATITVDSLAGIPVQEIGRTRAGEHTNGASGAVRLAKGLYRVVARGEVTLADDERRRFIARGPFLRIGE
jgi:uncharacterized lipoprotein YddW (UPF0748 family)